MYLKLHKMASAPHKLELHITQALKFGQAKNMATNAISGLWGASLTSYAHLKSPSRRAISHLSLEKSQKDNIQKSHPNILKN